MPSAQQNPAIRSPQNASACSSARNRASRSTSTWLVKADPSRPVIAHGALSQVTRRSVLLAQWSIVNRLTARIVQAYWDHRLLPLCRCPCARRRRLRDRCAPACNPGERIMPQSGFSPSAPKPIERPPCPLCGAQMMLTRIVPGVSGVEAVQVKYW